jgi:A/G-specific adenine glycosylase
VVPPPRTLRRIRRELLAWYARERRDFPWRRTRDPYAVLVSEVMLQQTQARRVAERYPRFLARFPTVAALAAAPRAAVLAEWSGLGYNRRALALQAAARAVAERGWPRDVHDLERLPGVGPYTARAVASLAFGAPVGVVDTNVRRWLVRRFGLAGGHAAAGGDPEQAGEGPAAGARELQALSDALARVGRPDTDEAAAWTHATMELGAAVCRGRAPRCDSCPIARGCPSRGRAAPVTLARQPAFAGSSRELRGRVLRALSTAPGHAIALSEAIALAPDPHRVTAVLAALGREELLHAVGELLHLGPAEGGERPATIGQ